LFNPKQISIEIIIKRIIVEEFSISLPLK